LHSRMPLGRVRVGVRARVRREFALENTIGSHAPVA
jgi:hypothetical protein